MKVIFETMKYHFDMSLKLFKNYNSRVPGINVIFTFLNERKVYIEYIFLRIVWTEICSQKI
jgi:hypothetical protein